MRAKGDHPADTEIARKEGVGIYAAPVRLRSRASNAAHHIQAAAYFVYEIGSTYLVVMQGELDVGRLRRERAGRECRVLLAIEKLELRVAIA